MKKMTLEKHLEEIKDKATQMAERADRGTGEEE